MEKNWYESKVVLMNILMALATILAVFYPPAAEVIKQYFAEAGMGWAILNIVLRIFKSNVVF